MRAPSGSRLQRFADRVNWRTISGPLFRKYVALFVAVVCVALITNGSVRGLVLLSGAQGLAHPHSARAGRRPPPRIDQFIEEIESQVGWTTQLPWSAGTIEQRRFDGLRLLRQVPAITELAQLDAPGQGAAARVAARDGRGRQPDRLLQGPEVHRGGGQEGLLRPGLFPPRIRALHDAGAGRHAPRRRRERRRGQPQADLGRRLADQGRPAAARPMWSTRRAA